MYFSIAIYLRFIQSLISFSPHYIYLSSIIVSFLLNLLLFISSGDMIIKDQTDRIHLIVKCLSGGKAMTIKEIAQKAGVSPAAVSIVLNGKKGVSESTRIKIQKLIEETDYVPTQRVRSSSRTIICLKYVNRGVFVEENEGFVSAIVDAMGEYCRKNDHKMIMAQLKGDVRSNIEEIDFSGICGAIVIASELPPSMYEDLNQIPVPFVVIDNMMPGTNYSCVGIDNAENVYTALKYCKTCGYQSIGYIRSSYFSENLTARGEAWQKYASTLKLNPIPEYVFSVGPTMLEAFSDLNQQLQGRKKEDLPECFFVDNDTIAIGAVRALQQNGFRIPEDIGIIGFDDIPFATVSAPPLTTIRVQRQTIGRQAIRQLLHILRDPASTPAKTAYVGKLIIRESMSEKGRQPKKPEAAL